MRPRNVDEETFIIRAELRKKIKENCEQMNTLDIFYT